MKLKKIALVSSLVVSGISVSSVSAQATTFTIGNLTPTTTYYVQGQSFTPSIQGNNGSGTPIGTPNSTVFLTSFNIDFDPNYTQVIPSVLYIYSAPPLISDVNNNGAGSIGTGNYIGGDTYFFNSLEIPFNTESYAVLPTSENILDGSGNTYSGGADLFPQGNSVSEGGAGFDIGFNASFSTVVPEPLNILGATTALALFGTVSTALKRRKLSK